MNTIKTIISKHTASTKIITHDKTLAYLHALDYIKNNGLTTAIDVAGNIRIEYLGDFYGLLLHLNTNREFLYINTLLNNLNSSNEYDGSLKTIVILEETNKKIEYIKTKLMNL